MLRNAPLACSVLPRISFLMSPYSLRLVPKYLKWDTFSTAWPLIFSSELTCFFEKTDAKKADGSANIPTVDMQAETELPGKTA